MGKQIHISAKNIKQKCGQRELGSTDTGSIKNFLIKIEPRGFGRSTTLRLFQVKIKRIATFLDTVNDKVDLFFRSYNVYSAEQNGRGVGRNTILVSRSFQQKVTLKLVLKLAANFFRQKNNTVFFNQTKHLTTSPP